MSRTFYLVTEGLLQDAVERILAAGSPEKIVMFGSRAEGYAKPDSDLDLLIIDSAAGDLDLWLRYHDAVYDVLDMPIDVLLRTPEDVALWRNVPNYFLTQIIREGRVLYDRQSDVLKESPPPADHIVHARLFLRIAERDLRRAERELASGEDPLAVCFWAQQAIEKCLKAILAYHGLVVPRTHSLKRLRKSVRQLRRVEIDSQIEKLTPYASNARYGEDLHASQEFADLAVVLARSVHEAVNRALWPETP